MVTMRYKLIFLLSEGRSEGCSMPSQKDNASKATNADVKQRKSFAQRIRDAGTILKLVIVLALMVGGYFAYLKISDTIDTVTGIIPEIGKPLVCPANLEARGLLCYEKCPDGWQSDGTLGCYQPCPADWPGTQSLTHCQHATVYSTVGADASLSVPNACGNGKTIFAGLCYNVPEGWHVTAPGFIGKLCPAGWRDDGTTCWQDIQTYGRGAGYPIWDEAKCRAENNGSCEKSGAIWYPTCKPGFVARGCCVCERPPKTISKTVKSEIGTLPDACSAGRELHGRLCYPTCQSGYERRGDNIEFCSSICPAGFANIGIGGCQKPRREVEGKGLTIVGVCPPDTPRREGELCFKS
jgi:hypothetical protein